MLLGEILNKIKDISKDTIAFYDKMGYIKPERVRVGKIERRIYSQQDFEMIAAIWRWHKQGFPPRAAHKMALQSIGWLSSTQATEEMKGEDWAPIRSGDCSDNNVFVGKGFEISLDPWMVTLLEEAEKKDVHLAAFIRRFAESLFEEDLEGIEYAIAAYWRLSSKELQQKASEDLRKSFSIFLKELAERIEEKLGSVFLSEGNNTSDKINQDSDSAKNKGHCNGSSS